jgi:tetratricopeptide (TPR) repeat protein
MSGTRASLSLIVIYSREDVKLLRKLVKHLSPLTHQGIVSVWYDHELPPGAVWRAEIETRLRSADIVLVLVSASCLASDHCRAEISLALQLHGAGRLRVVPIKLSEVDWEGEPLSELQVLPQHGGALSSSVDRDAEMAEIARAIRKLARSEIPANRQQEIDHVNDQALAMADQGDLSSARALLEPAIQAAREAGSGDLGTLLSNYAHVLRVAGELEAARRILLEALALSSPPDPAFAIRLDRLAGVLRDLGEPELALAPARQALAISMQAHGKDDPAVAVRRNTLGLIWTDLGKSEDAVREFEDALSILVRHHGERHPSVAAVRGNLALALWDRGALESARNHAEKALVDDTEAYPDSHPAIATDLNTLGLVLRDQGETSRAARCLLKALEIFFQVLGDLHPATRAVRENLRTAVLRVNRR